VSPILDAIKKDYPNLSQNTLEKLSTIDGIRNRKAIIEALPEEELINNNTPFESKISSIPTPHLTPLIELVEKSKTLENLRDLSIEDQNLLLTEVKTMKPSYAINVLEDIQDSNSKKYLIEASINSSLELIIKDNPGISKQEIVEKILIDNPNHKDIILKTVNETMNNQISLCRRKIIRKRF
jgi:hypothetical protein